MKEIQKEFEKAMMAAIAKQMEMPAVKIQCTATTNNSSVPNMWSYTIGGNGVVCGFTENRFDFIPVKVIFNAPATVCFFPDGSKVVVKCADDEEFVEEEGVMACIVKKIFGSRNSFKKLVREAYRQPKPEPKLLEPENEVQDSTNPTSSENISLFVRE